MKEMVIVNTNEQGDTDFEGPVEDQFDFSMEYDIYCYKMGNNQFNLSVS